MTICAHVLFVIRDVMPFDHALAQGEVLKTEEHSGYINTAQDIYRH